MVQRCLDAFVEYFNHKKTRYQHNKILPSGVSPQEVYDLPAKFFLEDLRIPVHQNSIDALCNEIPTTRKEAFQWVSDDFDNAAWQAYREIGSPQLILTDAWRIFHDMIQILKDHVAM